MNAHTIRPHTGYCYTYIIITSFISNNVGKVEIQRSEGYGQYMLRLRLIRLVLYIETRITWSIFFRVTWIIVFHQNMRS